MGDLVVSLTRPAATDTLASPALDQVLGEYADAIEALQGTHVTKRVTASLTSAMSGTGKSFTTAGNDLNSRLLFSFPVTPTRFRLKIRNFSCVYDGTRTPAPSGTATVTAYYGAPDAPAVGTDGLWRWSGGLAATPTQMTWGAATSTTLGTPSADTEIVSDWVTNTTYQSGDHAVISIGLANIYAGSFVSAGADSVGGLTREASGAAAAANSTTFTKTTGAQYVDVRCEYEYTTDVLEAGTVRNPVVLFIGDSITAGHLQSDYSTSGPYNYKIDCFPEQVGARHGYGIINAGVGQSRVRQSPISGTNSGWDQVTTTAHNFLARFDLATTLPDAAVIMIGTNDVGASSLQTFTNITASYATLIANLRTLGIDRIHLCTIPPGGYGLPLTYTASANNNDKTLTGISTTRLITVGMPVAGTSIAASTVVDSILSDSSVTINNATTGVISSGSLTFGSTAPDLDTAAKETLRAQLNTWIRSKPCNVHSVFDVDRALRGPLPATADAQYLPNYPHPIVRGFARIADAIDL